MTPSRLRRPALAAVVLSFAAGLLPVSPAASAPATSTTAAASSTTPALTPETFADPGKEVRPGTRWWWDSILTGGQLSLPDALEEVDAFADAGFGRFEIAWAAATYGTPEQQAHLKAIAERAKARGLQLDMTLGPGWPWAAPTTTGDLGQQELMYGRTHLVGPTSFSGEVAPAVGDAQPRGRLVAVTAGRVLENGDPVLVPHPGGTFVAPNNPPAKSTVLDPASLVDLTPRVSDTTLTWDVPAGQWIVFSFWQRDLSGTNVSLINEKSVRAGLDYVDANQLGAAEGAVREVGHSFFEDSLELHAEELFWTPQFLTEFSTRRGYDMTKYLPLMFVQGVSDYPVPQDEPNADFDLPDGEGARYRHDYYETLTDLYIDNHIEVVAEWATKYGMQFRTQPAFGNDFDVIRSARESVRAGALVDGESLNAGDTPFIPRADTPTLKEGYSDPDNPWWRFALDHYRQVTSGAHQGGQLEISTELGAWATQELARSLRDYKRMMDKEWAAGLTRPLLHGVTHSPAGTPWPGASHFQALFGESINHRTWPQWRHFKALSDYWARGALVLQQGAARTDVAVLRDDFVTTAAGPAVAPKAFFDALALEEAGFTIGYVDPLGLQEPSGADGALFPNGPSYDVLVVDPSLSYVGGRRLAGATAAALDEASAKGLEVVLVGDLPAQGTGGRAPAEEDRQVQAAVARVLARPTTAHVATQAEVADAVQRLGARPAAAWPTPTRVYSQLRETPDASYYLLWNATAEPVRLTGSFAATGAPTELDLWSGRFEPLAQYREADGRVELPLELAPHETTAIMFRADGRVHVTGTSADEVVLAGEDTVEVRDTEGGAQTVRSSDGREHVVQLASVTDAPLAVGATGTTTPWQLQVTTTGPEGDIERPAMTIPALLDWRLLPGLTTESGVGTYTTQVALPASWTQADRGIRLDLGDFEGSVQVSVNGTLVTEDIDPQAPLDITALTRPGANAVQVVLATTPLNKAIATPTTARTRAVWPTTVAQGTQPYGLLGEVRLLPYARAALRLRGRADLVVKTIAATQDKPKQTGLSADISNLGSAAAQEVVVEFRDGTTAVARSAPVTLAAGGTTTVTATWDTRAVRGDRSVTAVADPRDLVAETDESNNTFTRTVTIRGNQVVNGSFEDARDGTRPDGWSSSGTTSYDTSGGRASDGTDAVGVTAGLLGRGSWSTDVIPVQAGGSYRLALTAFDRALAPSVTVSYLDPTGRISGTLTSVATAVTSTGSAAVQVVGAVSVPPGVTQLRLHLTAPAAGATSSGTTWIDDVWLW